MAVLGFFQSLSLVEGVIYSFIAGNALLSCSFAARAGLRKASAREK